LKCARFGATRDGKKQPRKVIQRPIPYFKTFIFNRAIQAPTASIGRSSKAENGGAKSALDEQLPRPLNPHDFIAFSPKIRRPRPSEFRSLYDSGLSISQISDRLGVAKSTVRDALASAGAVLRNFKSRHKSKKYGTNVAHPGTMPYGFLSLDAQVVMDPREQSIIQTMLRLWQSGKSIKAICDQLNGRKVSTRSGRPWNPDVIRKIIKRSEKLR
jgi:hypothetical protein